MVRYTHQLLYPRYSVGTSVGMGPNIGLEKPRSLRCRYYKPCLQSTEARTFKELTGCLVLSVQRAGHMPAVRTALTHLMTG
jgi:hypothetical protein